MITTTISNIVYTGDGVTTTYSFNFPAILPTDIHCYVYDSTNTKTALTYQTDYTVTLNDTGGYVYLTNPVTNGNVLFINREVPYTQETEYTQNSPFPAKSHEKALDKLTMEIQQVYEKVSKIDSYFGEPATLTKYEFTATAGQTAFTVSGELTGVVFVYMNGVLLESSNDYSISVDTITLVTGAALNDILTVYVFSNFSLQDQTYTKADIDTLLAAKADVSLDNVSASDILTKLETVDTNSSGLNANYLQSLDSTKFMQVQNYNGTLISSDLNTIVKASTLYCDTTNANLPSAYNGTLLVTGNSVNKITQYFNSEDGNLYYRRSTDGINFSNWVNTRDAGHSFSANGYQKLPSGLIFQWGEVSISVSANTKTAWSWTFPIAFPNACLQAFSTAGNNNGQTNDTETLTTTSVSGYCQDGASVTLLIRVFAIGY